MTCTTTVFLLLAALLAGAASPGTAQAALPTLPALVAGGRFSILVELLQAANLLDTVVTTPDLTILAPTDGAFTRTARALGCGRVLTRAKTVSCLSGLLVKDGSTALLEKVLKYHVIAGKRLSANRLLSSMKPVATLAGKRERFTVGRGLMLIDLTAGVPNPRLFLPLVNLKYDNGVVHAVDHVLLPLNGLLLSMGKKCSPVEKVVVTKLGDFVSLDALENNARRCGKIRRAVMRCRKMRVCRRGRARRFIARRLTLGKVVAAVVTCNNAARAAVKGC